MSDEKLMPCPFCGCTAVLNAEDVPLHDEPELCCDNCNATNTRDFWNSRIAVRVDEAMIDRAIGAFDITCDPRETMRRCLKAALASNDKVSRENERSE